MSKIVFRGKTYNSIFEMPDDIRQAYKKSQKSSMTDMMNADPLANLDNMPSGIREIYERVLGNIDEKPAGTPALSELPKTEDLFSRSVPAGRSSKNYDDLIYEPSPPIIENATNPTIEPDPAIRKLILSLVLAGLVVGIIAAYFAFGL